MDNNTEDQTLMRCVAAVVCTLILTIGGCVMHKNHTFAVNGYVEKMAPSGNYTTTVWAKPE